MEKGYYKALKLLFERTDGVNLNRKQEIIADSSSDVNERPNTLEKQPEDLQKISNQEMAVPEEETSDADYLLDSNGLPQMEGPLEVSEKQKLLKLFSLFKTLLTYGEIFEENLEEINIEMIEEEVIKEIQVYTKEIKSLTEKIREYLENIFVEEKYEKSLYAYILMRTELLTAIKILRDLLKIDKDEEKKDI